MRAFIALEVPAHVLDSLVEFQGEVKSSGADLKLVERENLHFTLKFLGEISDAQVSDASSRLAKLGLQGVEVEVKGVGAFPTTARPRVVWAGAAPEDEGAVTSIADPVNESLRDIGERDERPFRAHITLARVRSPVNTKQLVDLLSRNTQRSFGKAKLTEFKLKSSVLTPGGPIYEDVGVYRLS